jgi:hypothetical protein
MFQLMLYKNNHVVEENLIFGKIPFTESPTPLQSLDIIREAGAADKINVGTSFLVKFKTSKTRPAKSTIRLTIPQGYTTQDPKCQYKNIREEFLQTRVTHSKREIYCIGVTQNLIDSEEQTIKVNGIVNPMQSG